MSAAQTGLVLAVLLLVGGLLADSIRLRRRLRRDAEASADRRDAELSAAGARAAAAERERIHNDLHDDLGARLLQLIYEAPTPRQADLARAVLQDLRDVVTRSRGSAGTLEHVLADIRREATQRLATIGTTLRWEQPEPLPDLPLAADRALHLYRIVREAISNALRHAEARRLRVRVRCTLERLDLELTDDGSAGPPLDPAAGRGMQTMKQRAGELQGEIAWLRGTEGGTKVLLSLPLAD